MNDKERLSAWMKENSLNLSQLAAKTGDVPQSVQQMVAGERALNQAFMWRFALAFGFEIAKQIFVEQPVENPHSVPVTA